MLVQRTNAHLCIIGCMNELHGYTFKYYSGRMGFEVLKRFILLKKLLHCLRIQIREFAML